MKEKFVGRPRLYHDDKAKVRAWRKKQTGRRLDGYINNSASWRLTKLAKAWECSLAAAVERLVMEADTVYDDILFPVADGSLVQ